MMLPALLLALGDGVLRVMSSDRFPPSTGLCVKARKNDFGLVSPENIFSTRSLSLQSVFIQIANGISHASPLFDKAQPYEVSRLWFSCEQLFPFAPWISPALSKLPSASWGLPWLISSLPRHWLLAVEAQFPCFNPVTGLNGVPSNVSMEFCGVLWAGVCIFRSIWCAKYTISNFGSS